jgi:hypothetical protein
MITKSPLPSPMPPSGTAAGEPLSRTALGPRHPWLRVLASAGGPPLLSASERRPPPPLRPRPRPRPRPRSCCCPPLPPPVPPSRFVGPPHCWAHHAASAGAAGFCGGGPPAAGCWGAGLLEPSPWLLLPSLHAQQDQSVWVPACGRFVCLNRCRPAAPLRRRADHEPRPARIAGRGAHTRCLPPRHAAHVR